MVQHLDNEQKDRLIASDLLISVKSAVRNYSCAITEIASPEVKSMLKRHLNDAIDFHEDVTMYMIDKGYYYPDDIEKQVQIDLANARFVSGETVRAYSQPTPFS